eukprot:sb/3474905/
MSSSFLLTSPGCLSSSLATARRLVGSKLLYTSHKSPSTTPGKCIYWMVIMGFTFHGNITAPIGQMISSTYRRTLIPHMHLKMLEEINILPAGKRHKHPNGSRESGVDEGLGTSGDQSSQVEVTHSLPNMEHT